MKQLVLLITMLLMLVSSCTVTRTTIGDGPVGKKGKTKVYAKAKRAYLFWGLVPIGQAQPAIPEHKNLQVKTSRNAWDAVIFGLTFGIVETRTVKILVKEEDYE